MKTDMPTDVNVSSKYGAPMGRPSSSDPPTNAVYLRRVPLVDGDYDKGGAYWGGGRDTPPLWCAWDDDGFEYYVRSLSRNAAKKQLEYKFGEIKYRRN